MQIFAGGGEEEVAGEREREGGRPLALFPSPFDDDDDDNAWLQHEGGPEEGGLTRPRPHKSRGPRHARTRGGGREGRGGEGAERTDYIVIHSDGAVAAAAEGKGKKKKKKVFCRRTSSS